MPARRLHDADADRPLELQAAQGATTADLVGVLGGSGDWLVDGVPLAAGAPLDALPDGASLVRLGPRGPARGHTIARAVVTSGPDAGGEIPLPAGVHTIGRATTSTIAIGDPTVAAVHAELVLHPQTPAVVRGAGNPTTTRDDGTGRTEVRVGCTRLVLAPGEVAAPGCGVLVRPPRRPLPPPPCPVAPPAPATPATSPAPFGWSALLAPAVLGIVMAVVLDPRMALFVLLSPVMFVGSWLEDRRRSRRAGREAEVEAAEELARFRMQLRAAANDARARLEAQVPDIAAVRHAARTGAGLWTRRPGEPDAGLLRIGIGAADVTIPVEAGRPLPRPLHDEVRLAGHLPDAPVAVPLDAHTAIAVVGQRSAAQRVARSLVLQACVHQGPSDLRVLVVTDLPEAWRWTEWLPHLGDTAAAARRSVVETPHDAADRIERAGMPTLLVFDRPGVAALAAVGRLVGDDDLDVRAVLLAPGANLPSVVHQVLTLDDGSPRARLEHLPTGETRTLVPDGVRLQLAEATARHLARWRDPEATDPGSGIPDVVALLDLLELGDTVESSAIAARWDAGEPSLRTPIGVGATGTVALDLVADGPHALLAGTTGAGKSELLRTLVAGLAASTDPEHLGFLLLDYKGGAAFDACAALPHVLGYVTDLDPQLAARAMTGLEAELHDRERRFRSAGVDALDAYWRARPDDVLPRLVVVVDEFATLATELPEFLDALVDVAQRGRSLGIHLVLATQRPGGVITDDIRANTALRLCLRVQDPTESRDVLDVPAAAELPRARPGRAYVRFGPDELIAFQAARITGHRRPGDHVLLRPITPDDADGPAASDVPDGPDDLERLVAACRQAATTRRPARRPWAEPLEAELVLAEVVDRSPGDGRVSIGRIDEPDHQRVRDLVVDLHAGGVAAFGMPGSGPVRALASTIVAAATTHAPDDLHVYVIDHGAGALAPLAALPHCGGYIGAGDRERGGRLIRHLHRELRRRRDLATTTRPPRPGHDVPWILVAVANLPAVVASFDDLAGFALRDQLESVLTEGGPLGVVPVVTADRPGALPPAVAAALPTRWCFRLGDPFDLATLGLPSQLAPRAIVGRGIEVERAHAIQIADPGPPDPIIAELRSRWQQPPSRPPHRIIALPEQLRLDELHPASDGAIPSDQERRRGRPSGSWDLRIGLDDDLEAAVLPWADGDHVLVAGSARSGRSTALLTLAAAVRRIRPDVQVVTVQPRPSPLDELDDATHVADLAAAAAAAAETTGAALLLIDDAERLEDDGAFGRLLREGRAGLRVAAAGRADALRTAYLHWTSELRRSRTGIVLRPVVELDGDLWQTSLPRNGPTHLPPGRGYLVIDGVPALVHMARP